MASPSDRIEAAIEKLTNVSVELQQMLAVHELRLSQQEKETSALDSKFEKRRDLMDDKLKDVYNTMRDQDSGILLEISKLRQESSEQHKTLSTKINQLEKFIWMAIGGGMMVTWLLTNFANYLKILH
jgi:hypothetical protein